MSPQPKESMDLLATHLEAMKIAALGWQQSAAAQEKTLADLRDRLKEEKQAQRALAA